MNFASAPINSILVFLIDVTGLTLIVTVFFADVKKILKLFFIFMAALMFIWVNLAFFARITLDKDQALLFIRSAWSITPLLFVLVYSFMTHIMKHARKRRLLSILLYILGATFIIITLFTDFVILDIKFVNGTLTIEYGKMVWFFFGWVAGLTTINFYILLKNYLRPDLEQSEKDRIKYLLGGLTIFFIANAIFNIAFPVFFRIFDQYEFGDYSLIVFMSILAYAVVRQNFFGYKVVGVTFITIFLGSFLLIDTFIFSTTPVQRLVKSGILVIYIPFGYQLVRSVLTEIKQRQQLQTLNKRLEELDDRKDEFISMAAHELRAPMTAIKGYLSMIFDGDTGHIPEKTREFLADTMDANDRLIRLVNNMLNVSRIEEGRLVYKLGFVNLNETSKFVFNTFKATAQRKNLQYTLEIQENIKDKVYVDQDRIHEVIGNFISNATKYTEKGGIAVKLFNPNPQTIRLEVTDTGIGISKQEQAKLFQKFYRAESHVGKTIGTGLGLYISNLLVQKFGGKIGINSEWGKGSTFWFELPVR